MGRAPCCDKANVRKGPWSPAEDAKLKAYIEQHGTGGNWIALPQKIGLKRCGKSCRLRWLNYLRPDIKHGGFSEEEDNIICSLYISIGSRWSVIAAQLPGRTDNDVKNYWNTRLKKKLLDGRPRKERQHGRRRATGSTKQEIKEAEKRTSKAAAADSHLQVPYWPQVPEFCLNQDRPIAVAAGHPSDGQFPVDVGGKLSEDGTASFPNPFHASPSMLAQQVCAQTSLSGLISPPTPPSFLNDGSSPPDGRVVQGSGGCLMSELEEILHFNPVKLEGLDGFYGVYSKMIDDTNAACTYSESLSWEEMSPLVSPPLIFDYERMHPSKQQQLFVEQLHSEML